MARIRFIPNSVYRVPFFLFLTLFVFCCSFLFVVFVLFLLCSFGSRWSFVDVLLIFLCPADHVRSTILVTICITVVMLWYDWWLCMVINTFV